MDYRIEEKPKLRIVGIKKRLSHAEDLGAEVGRAWGSLSQGTLQQISALADTAPFGIVGVYHGAYENQTTDYYIGTFSTQSCPEELEQLVLPAQSWAVLELKGPMPGAIQKAWTFIYAEDNPFGAYQQVQEGSAEIEWYSDGDMSSEAYESELWIPVTKK